MPNKKGDENGDCPCTWMEKARAVSFVIGAAVLSLTGAATTILGFLGYQQGQVNHQEIQDVRAEQAVVAQKAVETHKTLTMQTQKTDDKLQQIERAAETVSDTQGPVLWSTWKYLESVALNSGSVGDVAKAAEAKRAYDAYVAKKNNK